MPPIKRRLRDKSHSVAKEATPNRISKTRTNGIAVPYVTDATELLLTSEAGELLFLESTVFSLNLCISKSDVAAGAGNGLFVTARESDIMLNAGQIITWFSGKIEYSDEYSFLQMAAKQYTIGLGSSIRQASPVIISDPNDHNLMGCAHFANHSTKPNCELGYLQGEHGVNGVVLKIKKKTIIPQGHTLELVFNYGSSAVHTHGINGPCDFIPIPKLIEPSLEDVGYYDKICSKRLSDLEIDMPKKSREYSIEQMGVIAQQLLSPGTFEIIENPEQAVFTSLEQRAEIFYFIKITPELNQHCWVLAVFDRAINQLCLYDPEGLLFDKIAPRWLSSLQTPITFCHSWFVFSRKKHAQDPEYQRTGSICVELAKSMSEEALFVREEIQIQLHANAHWRLIRHFNLGHIESRSGKDTSALNMLLVPYPIRVTSVEPEARAAAIENIVAQQITLIQPAEDVAKQVKDEGKLEPGDETAITELFAAFDEAVASEPSVLQAEFLRFFNSAAPLALEDLGTLEDLEGDDVPFRPK